MKIELKYISDIIILKSYRNSIHSTYQEAPKYESIGNSHKKI
jgi:hypothetical protein